MPSYRRERVAQLLGRELGKMITSGEIKDPRVGSLVSVTRVEVSRDLAYAKVYVSSFPQNSSIDSAADALNHAAGFIQGTMAKRIRLRETPRLTFIADHGIEGGFIINEKIRQVISGGRPAAEESVSKSVGEKGLSSE